MSAGMQSQGRRVLASFSYSGVSVTRSSSPTSASDAITTVIACHREPTCPAAVAAATARIPTSRQRQRGGDSHACTSARSRRPPAGHALPDRTRAHTCEQATPAIWVPGSYAQLGGPPQACGGCRPHVWPHRGRSQDSVCAYELADSGSSCSCHSCAWRAELPSWLAGARQRAHKLTPGPMGQVATPMGVCLWRRPLIG